MKLLFVTPQLPYPPHQGTAIRNWGLLRHLAERHSVSLICFGQAVDAHLTQVCSDVITVTPPERGPGRRLLALLRGTADLADRLWSPALAAAVDEALRRTVFDIVQIEGLELAPYLATIRKARPATKVVYDAHNAEHLIQQRALANDWRNPRRWLAAAYSATQIVRLRRLEAATAHRVNAVTCVSTEDAAALRRVAPGTDPLVIPNGVDLSSYLPTDESTGPRRVVFTGKMDYRPNVDAAIWFAKEIWPAVRSAAPDAEFHIVGQRPASTVAALARFPGVVVTGAVPDIRPHLAGAAVYVAPLRMGGGTRFKLLEAFALARPVVSTRIGAEGFAVRDGSELRLADRTVDFAQAVLALLADRSEAARLGQAARAFVAAGYDWGQIVPRLEALYGQLLDLPGV
ncbi:MAG: glycosyltransferase [Anaerolineales bacterium]|nr:glycosyltransferase [Anaerolineales bacterium]